MEYYTETETTMSVENRVNSPLFCKNETVLLPNLKLKENKIYFTLKNQLKISINKKNTFINNFFIDNVSLYGKTNYNNILVNYNIINEEREYGLKIKIMYDENDFLYKLDIKKIAKSIEGDILGIIDYSNNQYNTTENNRSNSPLFSKQKENSMHYDSYSDTDSISYQEESYEDNNDYDDNNYDEVDDYDNR
jgi:hypothetical protein